MKLTKSRNVHPDDDTQLENGVAVESAEPRAKRRGSAAKRRRGAEPFDELLWRLQARRKTSDDSGSTIGLIGCEDRAGSTTIAANLAVRASELSLGPVLLVETSRGGRSLAREWRLARGAGLAELLAGEASLAECLRPGPAAGLSVLPCGQLRAGEIVAWEPGGVDALLAETAADHSLVIFDLPPASQMRQALMLARRLDQVIMVVRAEGTRKQDAARAASRLLDDGVPLAGAVLNRQRRYVPRWLHRWT
jgi:tyrosine-protein kinase Etk/Wzc